MIAVVSVDLYSKDACVIVAMDDELLDEAIEIVRHRNEKFKSEHCYVQRNIEYVSNEEVAKKIEKGQKRCRE